ncbi:MAG TPA: MarR family winged helix-turn-helix transcriptional regulator [Actinomycetota bacterium]
MELDEELRAELERMAVPHLTALAGHLLSRRWSRLMSQEHGVTIAGGTVLLLLASGEATPRQVARRMWVNPATITGIVDTLERDGLVERHRDAADRRQVRLSLTPRGRSLAVEVGAAVRVQLRPTPTELDPELAAVVRRYLIETITTHMEESDVDEGATPAGAERRRGGSA